MFLPLETERLLLRKVEQTDASFILEFFKNDDATKYMLYHFYHLDEVQIQMDYYENQYKNETGCYWLLQKKTTNESIGVIGLHNISKEHRKGEIGFWVLPQFTGLGYTTEVGRVIVDYCFTALNFNRVEATVETENFASQKVIEKLGFKYEGTFREFEMNNGKFIDLMMFASLAKEANIIK